jgi:ribonuclease-3
MKTITEFEKIIEYEFRNKELIETALTHSSYANECRDRNDNERLEFLGDAVLQLVTSEELYKEHPKMAEGYMSKQRAALVQEKALAEYAKEISLGDFIYLGHGEEVSGGRERPSILADAFEAVIGAVFLDGGFDRAKNYVLKFIEAAHLSLKDYKTLLQEIIQQNQGEQLSYVLVSEEGPAHDRKFTTQVHLNSNNIGRGTGRTKKRSEQSAAKQALMLMGYKFED